MQRKQVNTTIKLFAGTVHTFTQSSDDRTYETHAGMLISYTHSHWSISMRHVYSDLASVWNKCDKQNNDADWRFLKKIQMKWHHHHHHTGTHIWVHQTTTTKIYRQISLFCMLLQRVFRIKLENRMSVKIRFKRC